MLGLGRSVRVIVTRPRNQAGPLVARIEALGHEVVACPLIEIVSTGDDPVDTLRYLVMLLAPGDFTPPPGDAWRPAPGGTSADTAGWRDRPM